MVEALLIMRPLLDDRHVDITVGEIDGRTHAFDYLHAKSSGVEIHQPFSILRHNSQMADAGHNVEFSFRGSFIQPINIAFFLQALHGTKIEIFFEIKSGKFRRNPVSNVNCILDGSVVWDWN